MHQRRFMVRGATRLSNATVDPEAIPGIEDWLHDEGFSRSGAVHKKEEPVEDTIGAPLMAAEGTEGDEA